MDLPMKIVAVLAVAMPSAGFIYGFRRARARIAAAREESAKRQDSR